MKKQFIIAAFVCLGSSLLLSGCGDDFNISPCRKGDREHHHDDKNSQHQHHDSTAVNTPAAATQSGS